LVAALLAGRVAPDVLAQLAQGRLREKQEELKAALEGRVRAHHRFLLAQHLTHLDFLEEQVAQFDRQIETHLAGMEGTTRPEPPGGAPPGGAPPAEEPAEGSAEGLAVRQPATPEGASRPEAVPRALRQAPETPLSYTAAVQLLDPIPGIAERGAQAILAEIGTDMRRFATAGHLASWAGMCPGNNESAGKWRSGKTTEGNAALRKALTQAAHGATITKGSYFGALYRRLAARRGKRRAIVAVAHALLVTIYHMLFYQEPYRELGRDYYDERRKEGLIEHLVHRIEQLGYRATVELKPARQLA
jgi:transposase